MCSIKMKDSTSDKCLEYITFSYKLDIYDALIDHIL